VEPEETKVAEKKDPKKALEETFGDVK